MTSFVAYYRVSTPRQGVSGLGLEAQRAAALYHIGAGQLAAEYTEVESGKRDQNRPQLHAALEHCRRARAMLLIATLDRLARKLHFVSGLMESGVPFVCADMPNAGRFEMHIRAAMAEEEGRKISERTKAALAAAKARGVKLGNPRAMEALEIANAARLAAQPAPEVLRIMENLRSLGRSYRAIAEELNRLNIKTPRDCQWFHATVQRTLETAGKGSA